MPHPVFSPQISVLIPLFYVGWSDSVLSPSEINFLNQKIQLLDWMSMEDKKLIEQWMDPKNPPNAKTFESWRLSMVNAAEHFIEKDKINLMDLALQMAKVPDGKMEWVDEKVSKVLKDIQNALNLEEALISKIVREAILDEPASVENNSDKICSDLQKLLDADYAEIKERVFVLLKDKVFKQTNIRDKETYREAVKDWCEMVADQGLGALHLPEDYGGKNDMSAFAAVFETLGYHDLSLVVKFGVQFGLWGGSVLWLGTKKHHDKYLYDIGSMALPGCFAMTETGHGSNVRACETTATYDEASRSILIHSPTKASGKDYIGNAAAHGKMASVFAQLIVKGVNHGVHAILVPLRDDKGNVLPGVKIEDCAYKLGLNGVDNGRIWFDQVSVPLDNLLNKFGDIDEHGNYNSPIENPSKRFFTMLGTLVGGRMCVPRAGLSAAKSSLCIAVKYALHRRQFGQPDKEEMLIMDYPSHQRRLIPKIAKAYALDFALTELTRQFANRDVNDMRQIETMAAALKAEATWFTSETIQECREACGGKGYLSENRFADLKADSDIFTTFEGDNTVLLQLVAKGVLSDFNKEITEDGYKSMIAFLMKRISSTVREKNFLHSRNCDDLHLSDVAFYQAAFDYRFEDLSVSVGQRLRSNKKKGYSDHQTFLKCQNHLLEVAGAYIDKIILDNFVAVFDKYTAGKTRNILLKLLQLYALSCIEKHKGWYLEQGCMHGEKTKAIRRKVDKLCLELRIHVLDLVNAFGIPDHCLSAPIAQYS